MSRRILKQVFSQEPVQIIECPKEWRPLSFGNQRGDAVIWYEAGIESETIRRIVYLAFTGDIVPEGASYVGTATFGANDWIVVHCYVGNVRNA